jgi:hypothetical protein
LTSAEINLTSDSGSTTEYGTPVQFTLSRNGQLLTDNIQVYIDDGSPVSILHFDGRTSIQFTIEYQWLQAGGHVVKAVYGDPALHVESSLNHTVAKFQIVVRADDKAKYFNDPDPMLTVTYSKNPIGQDKIVGMVGYEGDDVGEHQIQQIYDYRISYSFGSSASNYQITFIPGVMRILPTMDIRDATSKISSIPDSVFTYEDADKVSAAYRSYISLTDDAKAQISPSLMNTLERGMQEAAAVNHASGVAFATDIPWNIRLTVDQLSESDGDYDRFAAELTRNRIIFLYEIVFTDTVTGKEYVSASSPGVTITGVSVPEGEVSMIREIDSAPMPVEHSFDGGSLVFTAASSGLFSLVADIDVREGANTSVAMVAIFLVVGGVAVSTVMNKRFRSYGP